LNDNDNGGFGGGEPGGGSYDGSVSAVDGSGNSGTGGPGNNGVDAASASGNSGMGDTTGGDPGSTSISAGTLELAAGPSFGKSVEVTIDASTAVLESMAKTAATPFEALAAAVQAGLAEAAKNSAINSQAPLGLYATDPQEVSVGSGAFGQQDNSVQWFTPSSGGGEGGGVG
jgi:hypothetical protein